MKQCAECGALVPHSERTTVKIGRFPFKKELYFCADCFCGENSQSAKHKILNEVAI